MMVSLLLFILAFQFDLKGDEDHIEFYFIFIVEPTLMYIVTFEKMKERS